ncbi:MAG: hypothetical protein IJW99_03065 [Clostridia bacterium]|nr:hypothetical protein [Clostridia bacterium]
MKKIISMCIVFVMLFALAIPAAADTLLIAPAPSSLPAKWDGTVATAFGGGTGTEADPYLITNAQELALIAKNVNETTTDYLGVYFKQTADINLEGAAWEAIGHSKSGISFKGVYDGGNYTIYNILNTPIDPADVSTKIYNGLFGWIADPAVIQNVKMVGGSVTGTKYAAAIVGFMNGGTVYNCVSDIDGIYGFQSGGVVGRAEKGEKNVIKGCINHSPVAVPADMAPQTSVFLGGMVGAAGNTEILYCANYGDITSNNGTSYSVAGGIIGIQGASSGTVLIDNCMDMGNITAVQGAAKNVGAGGIAGKAAHVSFSEIYNCFTAGKYTSDKENSAGGIAGYVDGAKFVTADNLYTSFEKISGADEMGQLANTKILKLEEMKGAAGIEKMGLNSAWSAEADMLPMFDVAKIEAAEKEATEVTTTAETTTVTTPEMTTTVPATETTAATTPAETTTVAEVTTTASPTEGESSETEQTPDTDDAVVETRDNTVLIVILSVAIVAVIGAMVGVMVVSKKKA